MLIGAAISLFGAIILVQIVGFGETEEVEEKQPVKPVLMANDTEVKNPLAGKVMALADVNDPVFSSGAMGNGIAIDPSDNKVYAPFNGTVLFVAETKTCDWIMLRRWN